MTQSTEKDKKSPSAASALGGSESRPAPGEVATRIAVPPPVSEQPDSKDGPKPGDGLPAGAPEGLKEAAGGPLDEGHSDKDAAEAAAKEKGALDFMLSNPSPQPFKVDALVDTPAGLKKLTFHMKQLDGSRIEAIENEHTQGVGPFATADRLKINAAKIAEATDKMVDENGKELTPTDEAFLRDSIAPAIAFERMFKLQPGVGDQIAEQIDRMAGATRDRVGMAEREMTAAAGNS
jgi:hypothetical protein